VPNATHVSTVNRPRWVDLATSDPKAAQEFYGSLFGWRMDVSDDPQYGGYAQAMNGELAAAGIGGTQDEAQPNVWSLYIGTDDIDALTTKVTDNGGTVFAPPFDVGDQGRMAIYQDPSGGFISAWQGSGAGTFLWDEPNSFGWAELNARNVADVVPFYENVFGWSVKHTEFAPDLPPYNEFQMAGESILGAWEMSPMVPAEVPSYWQVYFNVDDVDAAHARALELGANEMLPPQDYPGGRFSILMDPQGASFALLKGSGEPPAS
jgi:predicted enzyme related to lactoylglutathione lyase